MFKKVISLVLSFAMVFTMVLSFPLNIFAQELKLFTDFENYAVNSYPSAFTFRGKESAKVEQKVMEVDFGSTKTKAFRIVSDASSELYHLLDIPADIENRVVVDFYMKALSMEKLGEVSFVKSQADTSNLPRLVVDKGRLIATSIGDRNNTKTVASYVKDKWYRVTMDVDFTTNLYDVYLDSALVGEDLKFADITPDRIFFKTYSGVNKEMYIDNIGIYNAYSEIPSLKQLSIGGLFTAKDKVFDGTKAAEFETNTLALLGIDPNHNKVEIDEVKIEFVTANVGQQIQVNIISVTLKGEDALKYKVNLAGAPIDAANITPAAHTITFNVVGGNGTLTGIYNNANIASGSTVPTYSSVMFVATPSVGYKVNKWIINGEDMVANINVHTLNNITMNTTVAVVFEPITAVVTQYPVTFSVKDGNGAITAQVENLFITSPTNVDKGKNVVFTAYPAEGYRVKEWLVNGRITPMTETNKLVITNLSRALDVKVVFSIGLTPTPDDDEDKYPAAPALAHRILKKYNLSHKYLIEMKNNGKPKYGNLISEIARATKDETFNGISRYNKDEYYRAVYQFLKTKGAKLP